MLDEAILSLVTPENAAIHAAALDTKDIDALIPRLDSSEDKIRYPAFLLLRARSAIASDVYPFWDMLGEKLTSENSYQRSIGAMLLAENARHDTAGRMQDSLPQFLRLLSDIKPITVRQTAQALPEILHAKPELADAIGRALMAVDLLRYKDTMRKLILVDFLEALLLVREIHPTPDLEEYFFSVLSGSILDEKAKKQFRSKLSLPK